MLLAAFALSSGSAHAAQSARLHVRFAPYALGQSTNLDFNLDILAPAGQVPAPLVGLDVRYPSDLGLDVSGLGIATCPQGRLEELGETACSAESYMGQGSALAEIQIGPEIVHESAGVSIFRAAGEGHIAMLFDLEARTPVSAQFVLRALLLPAPAPFERIHIDVPLIPSLEGAPDVAVVRLNARFGPRGLTYYEHVHGKLVPYRPRGILLPSRCPHGGFPFAATLSFADGTSTIAATRVACPAIRG